MVAAFDFCAHGKGGAAPSIDTAMHALVVCDDVDHLHPDAGIALASSAEGEELTRECFGDRVVWVPWRRPGFQLGLDIAAVQRDIPTPSAWCSAGTASPPGGPAATSARRTRWGSSGPPVLEQRTARSSRAGRRRPGAAPQARRWNGLRHSSRSFAVSSAPISDSWATTPTPRWCSTSSPAGKSDVASRGTSCPDHFLRTKVRPLILDLAADSPLEIVKTGWRSCTASTGRSTRRTTTAGPRPLRLRCAGRTLPSCWCRASGCSASARQANRTRRR